MHRLDMNGKTKREDGASVGRSIDFLGYEFSVGNQRLRKSIKKRFSRKMKLKSRKRKYEIKCSYWGWCKYGKCRNLWNILTHNDMGFKDKGIKVRDVDRNGKKYFDVNMVRVMDILNEPITILSFVPNIETRGTDDKISNDRYVVLFENSSGKHKFITNSRSIKDVLDQAAEAEKNGNTIFPVERVALKRKDIGGGKCTFYFEDL